MYCIIYYLNFLYSIPLLYLPQYCQKSRIFYCFWRSQWICDVCFPRHMIELVVPTGIKALSCLDEWPYLPTYYKQIACSSRLFAVLGKTMVRCSYFNARLYDIYISCLTSIFLLFYKSLKRIVKSANWTVWWKQIILVSSDMFTEALLCLKRTLQTWIWNTWSRRVRCL